MLLFSLQRIISCCQILRISFADVYLNRIEYTCDYNVINCTINHTNSSPHTLLLNVDCDLWKNLSKVVIYAKLRIPEDSNDREFKKVFLSMTIDLRKFFNGAHSNALVKAFINAFLTSMNFEPKFPLKAVIWTSFFRLFSQLIFLQQTLELRNITIHDHFFMNFVRAKGVLELRFIAKPILEKKMVFASHYLFYGEIN